MLRQGPVLAGCSEQGSGVGMTPNQYRAALERLGLTQDSAAELLGVSLRTSHGYANGSPIPKATAKLLLLLIRLETETEAH